MKYFPIFRSRQYELIALRELSNLIAEKPFVPVIEPVAASNPLSVSLTNFVEAGMEFCLIVNPRLPKGNALSRDKVHNAIVAETLEEYDQYHPTLYVGGQSTVDGIKAFASRYPDLDRAYFLTSDPTSDVTKAIAADGPAYVLLRSPKISAGKRDRFPLDSRVLIEDPFEQRNNADYPPSESFCDRHLGTAAKDYAHFGDYSIVGDVFKETGGLPFAVAIHYVATQKPEKSELDVRHYVSDQISTRGKVPEKFLEALDKLIADVPKLGSFNRTATTDDLQELHKRQHNPGLASLKKLAMKRHLEMMAKLL